MPETTETTREERVNEYVVRSALVCVINNAAYMCNEVLRSAAVEYRPDWGTQNMTSDLDGGLLDELWPTDEDVDTQEFRLAEARACASASAMFATLASDEAREAMLAESARLAANAARLVKLAAPDA